MGGKNQYAMALQVSMSSMGFQGVCLSLEESDEDYAGLVPLLDQLPWEAGHINLGKTEEERIAEGTYTAGDPVWERSCGWSKSIEWKGKTLTISSDNGGFGSGAQVTDACDNFNALASQSSKYSTKHRAELTQLMTLEPQHLVMEPQHLVMEPQDERMTLDPQPEVPFYSGPVLDADGNQIAIIEAPATPESEDPKLDTLCADLERIATEMEVTEIIEVRQPEMTREVEETVYAVTSCCRMLGEVNGRSNFKEQAL